MNLLFRSKFKNKFFILLRYTFAIFLIVSNLQNSRSYGFEKTLENQNDEVKRNINKESLDNNLDIGYLDQLNSYNYILGEGDVIAIILSKAFPEFSDVYVVDTQGTINMPKIGRIFIKGLTSNELEILLNKKYENIFKSLSIDIEIKKYRPIRVYVNGEVNDPGIYVISNETLSNNDIYSLEEEAKLKNQLLMNNNIFRTNNFSSTELSGTNSASIDTYKYPTLFDAIQNAGGVTYYSDLSSVKVTRQNTISNGGGKIQTKINFLDIIENNNYKNNIRIYDGDVIEINKSEVPLVGQISNAIKSNLNPSYITISLTGRVEKPGIIQVTKSSTLNDAILAAGDARVLKGKVNFIRFNSDGEIDKRKFKLNKNSKRGAYNNPYLANGDMIHVGKSAFNVTNEVVREVVAPYLQIFSIYKIFWDN